jgi:hypothetical protein
MSKRVNYDVISYGEWTRPRKQNFREQCCDAGSSTGSISGSWMARSNSERGGTTVRPPPPAAPSSLRPMSDRFTAFV